jgi:2-amino-4-hydroxy-6-hydroxymethyldihydropteridine diphosphokinase
MRTLDIDLIAAGDMVLPDAETYSRWQGLAAEEQTRQTPDQLILPHPRLQDRAFVLVPLNDIAPHWQHPVLGLTVAQMLENLDENDVNAVVPL